MSDAFAEAREKLTANNLPIDGRPVSVYHKFNTKKRIFEYTSGLTVDESAGPAPEGMSTWTLPACQALRTEHVGSYNHLGNAWSAANQYARYKKLKQSKAGAFEIYLNDPNVTEPAELRTDVYLPLR